MSFGRIIWMSFTKRRIPVYSVSSIFRREQIFFNGTVELIAMY